jgi:hypothetical protein
MPGSAPIPDDVLHEVKYVRDQVWDVFGQWHLFTGLFASQETVDVLGWAFNRGAGGLIHQAIRTELAVGLGRLLDPAAEKVKKEDRHNLTVERMIVHVEAQGFVEAVGMRDKLAELRQLYKPLQRCRDKYHAHRDHAVAMGLEPIAQVDQETLDSLLSALRQLMDRICLALDRSQTPYASAYDGAAGQMLAFILPKYQASRERLQMAEAGL